MKRRMNDLLVMNEWMNAWMNASMISLWMNAWMNEWMNDWMNKRWIVSREHMYLQYGWLLIWAIKSLCFEKHKSWYGSKMKVGKNLNKGDSEWQSHAVNKGESEWQSNTMINQAISNPRSSYFLPTVTTQASFQPTRKSVSKTVTM